MDLLPLARRLWRDRLESRALKFLEEHVLEFKRSSDETPGYEIPWLYFDYLRTGDASPLAGVFYHNAIDVTAMAALLAHMNDMLENPYDGAVQHGLDFVALGKLFEDLGHAEEAAKLFERGLESPMGEADFHVVVKRLSILHKKRGGYEEAVRLWKKAAKAGHIYAHIELAKYYEHKMRDVKAALKWTESARKQTERADLSAVSSPRALLCGDIREPHDGRDLCRARRSDTFHEHAGNGLLRGGHGGHAVRARTSTLTSAPDPA